MNNAASRNVSVTMSQDGVPVAAATPGSTIVLQVQVQDAGPGPLHYRWTSATVNLAATDSASVTATLAEDSAQPVVNVKITNGKGGLLHGSIAIPLTTAPLRQKTLVFGILDDNGSL
jgi:hypothetical protein